MTTSSKTREISPLTTFSPPSSGRSGSGFLFPAPPSSKTRKRRVRVIHSSPFHVARAELDVDVDLDFDLDVDLRLDLASSATSSGVVTAVVRLRRASS